MIEYNKAMFAVIDPQTGELLHADGGSNLPYGHGVSILDGAPGRGSGRFGLGTGKDPQSYKNFIDIINYLEDNYKGQPGKNQKILEEFNKLIDDDHKAERLRNIKELTSKTRIAKNELKKVEFDTIRQLTEEGKTDTEIARIMGYKGESSVRSKKESILYNEGDRYTAIANKLVEQLGKSKYVDVSASTELQLGTKKPVLDTALDLLQDHGYVVRTVAFYQQGTGKTTRTQVLAPPGTTYKDIKEHPELVGTITDFSTDGGYTFKERKPPVSIDSSRIYIRYADDEPVSGKDRDGTIELRPGVQDISIGKNHIAQVRIAVDDEHYLKGVALYRNDIPEGYDLVFNSNKKRGTPIEEVFKPLKKSDPANPFGTNIKPDDKLVLAQRYYIGDDGKEHQSAINVVNEESDWGKWGKKIPYQFLAKQLPGVIKERLNETIDIRKKEFDEINALTNPIVKRSLMDEFAKECDSTSILLKAVGYNDQTTAVITPINSLKDNEVYAPNYDNGTKVIAIRYPHAGPVEIPVLTVNNKNQEGKEVLGQSSVAIGTTPATRAQLSGADCDGDTCVLIPMVNDKGELIDGRNFKYEKAREELINFEPKDYQVPKDKRVPEDEDGKPIRKPDKAAGEIARMSKKLKGTEMGKITNLLHDMQEQNAPIDDIVNADKFSMVVIDANKHYLDWRQAEHDFKIKDLRRRYQKEGGAGTFVTRARGEARVNDREEVTRHLKDFTPEEEEKWNNGERIFRDTGKTKWKPKLDENGNMIMKDNGKPELEDTGEPKQIKIHRMEKVENIEDPRRLISEAKTPSEVLYADYATRLINLGNQARKVVRSIAGYRKDVEASNKYKEEVDSLQRKLEEAKKNKPFERLAHRIVQSKMEAYKEEHGWDMDYEEEQKMKGRLLTQAREMVGSKRIPVTPTPKEWEAIQAHAVGSETLAQIMKNSDISTIRALATPRQTPKLSASDIAKIKQMLNDPNSKYTRKEIASKFDISVSTLFKVAG